MCNCRNIEPGSKECYNQMIVCDIPMHMELYREARINNGLTAQISIDPCIYEEIKSLWDKGIITYGSCCGHNLHESFVNVRDQDINKMLDMGYIQNHPNKNRKDTFKLKN